MVEVALQAEIDRATWPQSLKEAVAYSLMAGGKRLRPMLVLLGCEACGTDPARALPVACAIEMIHTYSLIHDDLPAMDDDDFRRGRPSNHRVFGEAMAILAGDCLLTLAFETLGNSDFSDSARVELMKVLASAAGGSGMVGGQTLDIEAERRNGGSSEDSEVRSNLSTEKSVEQLNSIHKMKTGALITAALELGAICGNAVAEHRRLLRQYGEYIGLAFQISDDLLDVTGDGVKLGKDTGRDVQLGKLTYPGIFGIAESHKKAANLVDSACQVLLPLGTRGTWLQSLATFIVERDH
jgi:geranylgeranyl diphosphate synthase type II